MNTSIPMPEPSDEDVQNTLAELEKYLTSQTSTAGPTDTKRVRELRAEVVEAHQLLALQGDATPLLVDSERVRRTRKRAAEASQLHALAQDPAARAWQAARVRLVLTAVALAALVGALGWSTTGVHHTLTRPTAERGAAWWGAWAVEPVISAVLLVVVAAKAYLATRGQVLRHRNLSMVEISALVVTLTLNIWPYTPWQIDQFDPMQLLAHAIGPLVAIGTVTIMPVIWTAFTDLDHDIVPVGATPPEYSQNGSTKDTTAERSTAIRAALLVKRARHLIATGRLPAAPSATRLREALGCGTDAAREVRDTLRPDAV
jgi:hypothetical protein